MEEIKIVFKEKKLILSGHGTNKQVAIKDIFNQTYIRLISLNVFVYVCRACGFIVFDETKKALAILTNCLW